jgi:hypothetical protein
VGGRRLTFCESGAKMVRTGSDVQMKFVLIAILDKASRRQRIRERSPRGPPRARCASLFSPHMEEMMNGYRRQYQSEGA